MSRLIAVLLVALGVVVGTGRAYAQERPAGPGVVEVTIIPAGGTFFTESKDTKGPSFGNYDLGAALTLNVNRYLGIEGEVSGALGIKQDLPYVTGGVGGLSVFERTGLGINGTETFLTGNVGGGLKWYAGRWGLRADYRFVAVRSKDDAPDFFGHETRYGHRVYGGVILNVGR
jgi:hypothetical protein